MYYVYANRALGIPSTIDIVPYWGKKSGAHAADVMYTFNKERKKWRFQPVVGFEFPPKVFRLNFKKTGFFKKIKKLNNQYLYKYLPQSLLSDHLSDVTDEYTPTINLNFKTNLKINDNVAFICVYNYGQWKPLFYGQVTQNNNSIVFNKMATDMAYRIGLGEKDSLKMITPPFIVDSLGMIKYSEPNHQKISIKVTKINMGAEAQLKPNQNYQLFYLQADNWISVGIKKCLENNLSITFNGVPSNGFYLIKEINSAKNLGRIFRYIDNRQIWY